MRPPTMRVRPLLVDDARHALAVLPAKGCDGDALVDACRCGGQGVAAALAGGRAVRQPDKAAAAAYLHAPFAAGARISVANPT